MKSLRKLTVKRGGPSWMPFTFLYFVFYASSQREQVTSPGEDRPTYFTSTVIFYILMGPTFGVLALADRATGWEAIWTGWWVSMHLPTLGHNASVLPCFAVAVLIEIVFYRIFFGKKNYDWIRNKFHDYSASELRFSLLFFFFVPFFSTIMVSIYAVGVDPVRGDIVIGSIFVVVEIIFRIWWGLNYKIT